MCENAGNLDPKTLTAIEKGRIKNPSIKSLRSVAKGLRMSISEIFARAELQKEEYFHLGSQKGTYKLDFLTKGIELISFTPLLGDFFCGKLIVEGKKRFDGALLKHSAPLFVLTLLGSFEVEVENKKVNLREGENLFFYGGMKYQFRNSRHRNSVLLLITAPSFLSLRNDRPVGRWRKLK